MTSDLNGSYYSLQMEHRLENCKSKDLKALRLNLEKRVCLLFSIHLKFSFERDVTCNVLELLTKQRWVRCGSKAGIQTSDLWIR